MKTQILSLILSSLAVLAAGQAPPANPGEPAPASATPAPPPAAPAKRSAADLEKLVAPIALYPDPLIATVLPASVYPLEIVQAARFVANTNNLDQLDAQPWDDNVKAVARVPEAIKKLNEDISWTVELGEAFLAQDKDVMDAIQSMRGKAQKVGTLQTTPQQIVTVTNVVVERTIEQQVVVVTNTVVEIQPASPSVVYVPTYNPTTVYYPPPAYVYDPIAPLVTFGVGMAMGAIIANNCDWNGGGCYHGDVDIDVDRNVNRNTNRNVNRNSNNTRNNVSGQAAGQKWKPDQNRLSKSGSSGVASSARSAEARGWNSGGAGAGARPSTGAGGTRPSTSSVGAKPSTGNPSANRPAASSSANRPSPSPSASQSKASPAAGRSSSSGSAFGGVSSGASARDSSSRGSSSRGGGGGGRMGGGGGGRGGGGRR